jgi:hypothetical protein
MKMAKSETTTKSKYTTIRVQPSVSFRSPSGKKGQLLFTKKSTTGILAVTFRIDGKAVYTGRWIDEAKAKADHAASLSKAKAMGWTISEAGTQAPKLGQTGAIPKAV